MQAALEALATICASPEHGQRHREECRAQGCVLLLVGLLESAGDSETLVQVRGRGWVQYGFGFAFYLLSVSDFEAYRMKFQKDWLCAMKNSLFRIRY